MRIAYVCADRGVPLMGCSGSSIHVREFAAALAERGSAITMFAANVADGGHQGRPTPFAVVDLGTEETLHALRTGIARELRAVGREPTRASETYGLLLNQTLLEELLRRRGTIDVVYERCSLWSFAGLQFARREGLPFFLEVNAPLSVQQREYRDLDMMETARAVERLLISRADRVIVTSPVLKEYAHAQGASRRNIRIIGCGVSRHLFQPAARPPSRTGAEFVVGFVGSLKPWHGVDILLEAFRELAGLSSSYRLLVVGDGPMRSEVESFCRLHHLSAVVTLVGSVDHDRVSEYLEQMDVGLAPYPPLPSFYFSPLKIWEYAAAGVPIVASASGEVARLFPHRTAALLHPPGNVRKIVKHVERLQQDRSLGQRLARRARRIAKRHTWDRLAARFERLAGKFIA